MRKLLRTDLLVVNTVNVELTLQGDGLHSKKQCCQGCCCAWQSKERHDSLTLACLSNSTAATQKTCRLLSCHQIGQQALQKLRHSLLGLLEADFTDLIAVPCCCYATKYIIYIVRPLALQLIALPSRSISFAFPSH